MIILLSGKSIGFLLPAFQQLFLTKKNPPSQQNGAAGSTYRTFASKVPTVLAPTGEMTVQIEKEAHKYCSAGVRSACHYAMVSMLPSAHVVVAMI